MIVLTTPTGNIGRKVLRHLFANSNSPLRVIARNRSRLPRELVDHIEVVEGSMEDGEVLSRAFTGADTLFWCQPDKLQAGKYLDAHDELAGRAAEAIREAGIKRVVAISAAGPKPDKPAGPITVLHRIEAALAPTGAACRFLRCGSFFENLLCQWDSIVGQGVFTYPMDGAVKRPHVTTVDIARNAVDWLRRDHWAGVEPVQVLGPCDLSFHEMAEILTRELGRSVTYERSEPEMYRRSLRMQGIRLSAAQGYVDMFAFLQNGYHIDPTTPRSNTPTTLAAWLNRED